MIFAALLLLAPVPLFGDVTLPISSSETKISVPSGKTAAHRAAPDGLSAEPSPTALAAEELTAPSMPEPKAIIKESSSAQPAGFAFEPVKPLTQRSFENRNEKKIWFGLAAAGHAGAAFDAWSTRRALSGN